MRSALISKSIRNPGLGLLAFLFFACDSSTGPAFVSGQAWTAQVSGTTSSLQSVAWTGHQLVAVGYNFDSDSNTILTSPDGVNWTARNSGTSGFLSSVIWTGSQLVAVGNGDTSGIALTSTDGVTWITRSMGKSTSGEINAVIWADNWLVAVGGRSAGTLILVSHDGITWTSLGNSVSGAGTLNSVTWTGHQFVAVGASILTSQNGVNWTVNPMETEEPLSSVIWTGKEAVAVGGGNVLTSPDATTWTKLHNPDTLQHAADSVDFEAVTWARNQLVAVAGNSKIDSQVVMTSSDANNWTTQFSGTAQLRALAWTGSKLVVVGENGTILTSP